MNYNCSSFMKSLKWDVFTLFNTYLIDRDDLNSIASKNSSQSVCEKIHHSIYEFPPDFFTKEQRRNGAIVIHLLVVVYGFIFISFICHGYFLPSIFCICLDLGISSDVAGATFMATATCTSELFVNIIGTFLTESDIGVGTVVGSGVYNTLGVSACAGLATNQAITMEKWPLIRDSGIYVTATSVLAAIAIDNVIVWYEALVMVVMYFGYFLFLFQQHKLVKTVKEFKNENQFRTWTLVFVHLKQLFLNALFCKKFTTDEFQYITAHNSYSNAYHYGTECQSPPTITIITTSSASSKSDQISSMIEPITSSHSTLPDNVLLLKIWSILCLPITFILLVTIPDCKTNRKFYPLTFIMAIVWISVVMYILSWMLTICGDTFRISDIIMGIGILAIGSSIPEVVSGIINARRGEGAMIISSALGSNTMDILLCLGLPWLVKCLLPGSMNGGPIRLETNNLFFNCMCMIASVVILIAVAIVCEFQLHRPFGFLCLIGLIVVISMLIINVFKDPRTARC
ncbi:sodium/potassium/calcium exchanger 2-like [Sipha flava]|uniref:Sodium/potassium/calcium exchanger 2-like n=2 Tax=Sipha flava TaxID=143950 RepID=A0A8B8FUX4_9HEMI|nr:sodium/potassium/calcium exchanger 2-like [Sipha flava]